MFAIFCDDARQEVGNKVSFMGVYGGQLFLPQMPSVLPKLCVAMHARTPIKKPFQQLKFRVLKNDELLSEIEIDEATLAAAVKAAFPRDGESQFIQCAFIVQTITVAVNEPFMLRARAITETEELKGGSLSIEVQPSAKL